jgi:hypothetical protein
MISLSGQELNQNAVLCELFAHLHMEEDPDVCLQTLNNHSLKTQQTEQLSEKIATKAANLYNDKQTLFSVIYRKIKLIGSPQLAPLLTILDSVTTQRSKTPSRSRVAWNDAPHTPEAYLKPSLSNIDTTANNVNAYSNHHRMPLLF